jgi:hypothetical protein
MCFSYSALASAEGTRGSLSGICCLASKVHNRLRRSGFVRTSTIPGYQGTLTSNHVVSNSCQTMCTKTAGRHRDCRLRRFLGNQNEAFCFVGICGWTGRERSFSGGPEARLQISRRVVSSAVPRYE